MPERGKFIVFEGIDGCGKTTQFNILHKWLTQRGVPCLAEKEPTDGIIGRLARETVKKELVLRHETLALLFAADRIEHIDTILSALQGGLNVLCDRYVFSSLAYQSTALPMEKIIEANSYSISTLLPDLTIFIDAEPEISMKRINENRSAADLFESAAQAREIRKNYYTAFEKLQVNVEIIDGNVGIDETADSVLKATKPLLGL